MGRRRNSSVHFSEGALDFKLPKELIAQSALEERDKARLMVLDRKSGRISHRQFSDLSILLKAGDVLVLNKAKVNYSKVLGRKLTGGRVEVIFVKPEELSGYWKALVRPYVNEGTVFQLAEKTMVRVLAREPNGGEYVLEWQEGVPISDLIRTEGRIPLPPYINRRDGDGLENKDQESYQTIYASVPGSIAAPTAGLHFSKSLLDELTKIGVNIFEILLHVGWGTFKPIATTMDDHHMLAESYEIDPKVYRELCQAQKENRRIIAVGTTSTRVLESLPMDHPQPPLQGETSLFIKPGFPFQWISGLITNFHVPRSTPIALTAAFFGLDKLEKAYEEAIQEKYRFYSYGDAMVIL